MTLVPGIISGPLIQLVSSSQGAVQEDPNTAIVNFCTQFESIMITAIQSATPTMPPGSIQTVGTPNAQSNLIPAIGFIT